MAHVRNQSEQMLLKIASCQLVMDYQSTVYSMKHSMSHISKIGCITNPYIIIPDLFVSKNNFLACIGLIYSIQCLMYVLCFHHINNAIMQNLI